MGRIEEAFQLQKSFISNVSHEIKNPIAAIDAQIQLVKTKFKENPEASNMLDSIHEDIIEINETNDKLLQLSKFYSDKASVKFEFVRIDEIIFDSIDYVSKSDKLSKINIEFIQMPEDESKLKVLGNEFLLRSAVINLLENACKFATDQTAQITLDFSNTYKIDIDIVNKTKSLTVDDLNKLFEPFYRSVNHNSIKGSGLGLSIVKSIIDLHHFSIAVSMIDSDHINFNISIPTA